MDVLFETTKNMISKIKERIVLNDHVSDFEAMLWNINDIIVTIEMFKLLSTFLLLQSWILR